jgi:glycosyltransferase involved in cell wall biosynthesis
VKRFDVLIDALAVAKERCPGLQAVIVGEGDDRSMLQARIDAVGGRDWLTMPGRLSDSDLVALYRRAWVLASSSAREGWGMTITEAAACGTPAVATDISGHRDAIVRDVSGLLVDVPDLAAAITRVLDDPSLRDRLAAGALARAAELTWESTAAGTLRVLIEDARRRKR